MPDQTFNPIQGIREAGSTAQYSAVPVPSKYDWKLSDVSASTSGRDETGAMHKEYITQKVHLELEWQNIGDAYSSVILQAFQPQYIEVKYYDYRLLSVQTKIFYVGDREVSTYSRRLGIGTLTFNIIEV